MEIRIPARLVDAKRKAVLHEVDQWLIEQGATVLKEIETCALTRPYSSAPFSYTEKVWRYSGTYQFTHFVGCTIILHFSNQSDAAFFKLRWL